ncbi:unnamed protein product [Mytilus edulis]|uniref:Apple domain-containing protein n=1 Tax=Mytilus edulis TaxID=6550 RepID=A0A8S3UMY0_MYTED|nr:unnamed protein product [Mytilus edulis]
MNATKNAKGRDDEIQTVWEASSLKECEIQCIKTDDCGAVHFDGLRCFKFNTKTEPNENTGTDFSSKICVEFNDEYDEINMLLEKALWILAFTLVSLTSEVYGLDWPWNWTKEDVTCYTTCLAAVGTGTVVATPFALSAAGFGTAGIVASSFAAKIMSMIGVVKAGGWFAFLQSVGVTGVGTTGKMVLASTVSPLCAAICGSSEEIQDLKCHTHRINEMKGFDENVIKAEIVDKIAQCEDLCNDQRVQGLPISAEK